MIKILVTKVRGLYEKNQESQILVPIYFSTPGFHFLTLESEHSTSDSQHLSEI